MATKFQKLVKQVIHDELGDDTKVVCKRDGTVEVYRYYFYAHGMDSQKWADRVDQVLLLSDNGLAIQVEGRNEYRSWPADSYFIATVTNIRPEPKEVAAKVKANQVHEPEEVGLKLVKVNKQERDRSERHSKPRVYIFVEGENIWENVINRTSRPYTLYRKYIMPAVLREVGLEGTKFNWSQYAGCSCPCSPGFILDIGGFTHYDVFVTITADEPDKAKFDPSFDALYERASRAQALRDDPTLPVGKAEEEPDDVEELMDKMAS